MVLKEGFEGFEGDLAVEEEVFVVQDEEESSGAGLKVFQVAALDTQSTVAAFVWDVEGMVVDLAVCKLAIQ